MTKHDAAVETEILERPAQAKREAIYIPGHSYQEIRRLIDQAAILGSTTERLLRSAGVEHGMRVLDLGCGAGDPVAFLRTAARFVRPGGVLALHEPILDLPVNSRPPVALWQQTSDWLLTTFRRGAPSYDAAGRLIEYFSSAGLPQPALFSETPVGGGIDAPHYAWLAGVTPTLLPRIVETDLVTAETLAIDTLESRLRSAAVEARSQIISGNTAWVAYVNKGSIGDAAGTENQDWLESAFLQKQAGVWKIVFMHSTRVTMPTR